MSGFLIEKNRRLAYIGLFLGLIGLVLAMLGAKGLLAV
jgi:hypothetical protein